MSEGSIGEIFKKQAVASLIMETIVAIKFWTLDALSAMLLGMVLFRSGFLTLQISSKTYLSVMLAAYAIGLPLSWMEVDTVLSSDFDPLIQARTMLSYDLSRLLMGLGHSASILLLVRHALPQNIKGPLARTGQMALTNYLTQSILCAFIFYSFGFGLYGKIPGANLYIIVMAIWALQIMWSTLWLNRFRFGPFEWVWRSLTYGKAQKLRN